MGNVERYLCGLGPLGTTPDDPARADGWRRRGRVTGPVGFGEFDDPFAFGDDTCGCWLGGGPIPSAPMATTPSAPSATVSTVAASVANLKSEIVRIANEEWDRWNVRGHRRTERDTRMAVTLQDYWQTGVPFGVTLTQLADAAWQELHPWSAAFISWVMRAAGAGTGTDGFRYAAMHSRYVAWAKANRLARNNSRFRAYRLDEVEPELGDLVCKARAGSGATYDNIREGMLSHCDYVTELDDGSGRLVTIGGNVAQSVSKTTVTLDADGHVNQANYFAILKIQDPATALP